MASCHDQITPILESILDCVTQAFVDCGAPGFCREGIVAGSVAFDDCCECDVDTEGQLWVRLADWAPDPAFPDPNPWAHTNLPTVATVGVGALRCYPSIDAGGFAPLAADEEIAAARIHADAQLIFNAVMCCGGLNRTWNGWVPLDGGGCGGGEHLFTVPLGGCDCELGSPGSP